MNKKRAICMAIALMVGGSTTGYAEIPKGTVIIGNKAYHMKYANDINNLKEIREAIKNSEGGIYIKSLRGKWYDNSTGKETTSDNLPKVEYKDAAGEVSLYAEKDGEEILHGIKGVEISNPKEIKICFMNKMDKDSLKNKENYKIGNEALSEEDEIIVNEEANEIIIKLNNGFGNKAEDTEISIAKELKDVYGNEMQEVFQRSFIVVNTSKFEYKQNDVKDIYIIKNKCTVKSIHTKGRIFVNAENVSMDNIDADVQVLGGYIKKLEIEGNSDKKDFFIDGKIEVLEVKKESNIAFGNKAEIKELKVYKDIIIEGSKSVKIDSIKADTNVKVSRIDAAGNLVALETLPLSNGAVYSGGGGGVPTPPTNSKPEAKKVKVSGTLKKGQTLTAGYEYYDKDGDREGTTKYQWVIADDAAGTNQSIVDGRESNRYVISENDIGKYIGVKVTPYAVEGEKEGNSVTSTFVGPVADEATPPDNSKPEARSINISGELVEGKTLRASYEYYDKENDPEGNTEMQWFIADNASGMNKKSIVGAKATTYKISAENVGKYIGVEVTPKASAGTELGEVSASNFVGPVKKEDVIDEDTVKPVITMVGEKNITLKVNEEYIDRGATAQDDRDGNITSSIITTIKDADGNTVTSVDTSKVGVFTIHYNVSDAAGNIANEVVRSVNVIKDQVQEDTMNISVNGKVVSIAVYGDKIQGAVTLRVVNKETGAIVDSQQATAQNNRVDFTRRIEKEGRYSVVVRVNQTGIELEGEFTISSGEDTEKPSININGKKYIEIFEGSEFVDPGATAWDNVDGDITSLIEMQIKNSEGNNVQQIDTSKEAVYKIHYNVSDKAGNKADEAVREVKVVKNVVVDEEKPVISINGNSSITINIGENYQELGATATDNKDGDITSSIEIKIKDSDGNVVSEIDTSKEAVFKVYYNVADEAGNIADEVVRTVSVKREGFVEDSMNITVQDKNVSIVVEGDNISGAVTLRIVKKDTGAIVDSQQATAENNKVEFTRRIEKEGIYSVVVRVNGTGIQFEKEFSISSENNDYEKPVISIKGKEIVIVNVGEAYTDLGVQAQDNKDGDISSLVEITITNESGEVVSEIDTSSPGIYTVHYNVSDESGNKANEVVRTVKVLKAYAGDDEIQVSVHDKMVTVAVQGDNIEGIVTMRIVNKETGVICDSQQKEAEGNRVEFTRRIDSAGTYSIVVKVNGIELNEEFLVEEDQVDRVKPVITLKGESNVMIKVGKVYSDRGATAQDDVDGDISTGIMISIKDSEGNLVNKVDTSKVGMFIIHYNVTDAAGNIAEEVIRRVNVITDSIEEDTMDISVDGKEVEISVQGENILGTVTLRIIDKETGAVVDSQQGKAQNNRVNFSRRIEKEGVYSVVVKAGGTGVELQKDFAITSENVDLEKPIIRIVGEENIILNVGETYTEFGAWAQDNKDGDLTSGITINIKDKLGENVTRIDTSKAGEFTVHYNVCDSSGNMAEEAVRAVKVIESYVGEDRMDISVNKTNVSVLLRGENIVGTVTLRIVNKDTGAVIDSQQKAAEGNSVEFTRRIDNDGTYSVLARVNDSGTEFSGDFTIASGNTDLEKPVITLKGRKFIEVLEGSVVEDPGAAALDNVDGDISSKIFKITLDQWNNQITESLTQPGEYRVIYKVADNAGNNSESIIRYITIKEKDLKPVKVEVDGYNVSIKVTGENLEDKVTMRIKNNETGSVEDAQSKYSVDGEVIFRRRIEKCGEFMIQFDSIMGQEDYSCTFNIYGENSEMDEVKPVIVLKGDEKVVLQDWREYQEAGFTAYDNFDGNLNEKVERYFLNESGEVVATLECEGNGIFQAIYLVEDESGNISDLVKRSIVVEAEIDERVQVSVEGKNVTVVVAGEEMDEFAVITIFESETGRIVDIQQKRTNNENVIFTRILESGKYNIRVSAFKDGKTIVKNFEVK